MQGLASSATALGTAISIVGPASTATATANNDSNENNRGDAQHCQAIDTTTTRYITDSNSNRHRNKFYLWQLLANVSNFHRHGNVYGGIITRATTASYYFT
jgi:hypothetical protein